MPPRAPWPDGFQHRRAARDVFLFGEHASGRPGAPARKNAFDCSSSANNAHSRCIVHPTQLASPSLVVVERARACRCRRQRCNRCCVLGVRVLHHDEHELLVRGDHHLVFRCSHPKEGQVVLRRPHRQRDSLGSEGRPASASLAEPGKLPGIEFKQLLLTVPSTCFTADRAMLQSCETPRDAGPNRGEVGVRPTKPAWACEACLTRGGRRRNENGSRTTCAPRTSWSAPPSWSSAGARRRGSQ